MRYDRAAVRAVFERRFTSEVMAERYVRLYSQLARGRSQDLDLAPGLTRMDPAATAALYSTMS